jgi:DNA-binding IclR family transcriptional regulator
VSAPESTGVKSAGRVLDVLEHLAAAPDGVSFPALCAELQVPKSSLHALLATLADRGWVYLHHSTRQYRIGVRAWQAGRSFSGLDALAQLAQPSLEAASAELNETVQLAVLDGVDNVYVAKVDSDHPLQLVSRVGSRLPAYATGLGKVLLADLAPDELRRRMRGVEFQRFTDRTITDLGALERALVEARANGFAQDEGEYTTGVFCVAVPIVDATGTVVAAMSCSVPSPRFDGTDRARAALIATLSQHGAALSGRVAGAAITVDQHPSGRGRIDAVAPARPDDRRRPTGGPEPTPHGGRAR